MPVLVNFGGGSSTLPIAATAYDLASSIPSTGRASLIDIAIVSSVACPSISSGGIMVGPVKTKPTARYNGGVLQNGDTFIAYADIGNNVPIISGVIGLPVIAIYQYLSSVWTRVPAKISNYGAAYIDVMLALYYLGAEFAALTGGWSLINTTYATKGSDYLLISAPANQFTAVYTAQKINLTDVSTLRFLSRRDPNRTYPCIAGITTDISTSSKGYGNRAAGVTLTSNTVETISELDVDPYVGDHYVAMWGVDGSNPRGSYLKEVYQ